MTADQLTMFSDALSDLITVENQSSSGFLGRRAEGGG